MHLRSLFLIRHECEIQHGEQIDGVWSWESDFYLPSHKVHLHFGQDFLHVITHTDCVKQYQIVCLWEFKIKMLQQEVLISIGITKNKVKKSKLCNLSNAFVTEFPKRVCVVTSTEKMADTEKMIAYQMTITFWLIFFFFFWSKFSLLWVY